MASVSKGRGLSSLVDKLQNYISSYTSSAASWLTYPYYGISTGVTSLIVIFVVIYILIIGQFNFLTLFDVPCFITNRFVASSLPVILTNTVSGSVVTTSGRSFVDHMGVNTEELDRLAHAVLNAVDHLATKLDRNGRSADPVGQ